MKQDSFLAQSYRDAINDYLYSCDNVRSERWDWVVLTAANNRQADAYRIQLELREKQGRLPKATKFTVVTDYNEERVGSGGATLNVLRVLSEEVGIENLLKEKILIMQSGGDSKRIPQYSACGKLFAPIPRLLPGGHVSTLFDELLIAAIDVPNRCGKGMMIFPNDTEFLFNSLQLDLFFCDAAGLSMKAPVHLGQDHGVFVQGENTNDQRNHDVAQFLHKQSAAVLASHGAVDDLNQVDIDTGCIWFSSRLIKELYGLISVDNVFDQKRFEKYVNPKVCLNFYSDFVYPLATDSTLENYYQEAPENGFSEELCSCRRAIFDRLHQYRLSLVKLVPARYIHVGTTQEICELFVNDISKYSFLGWERRLYTNATTGTVLNSLVSSDSVIPDSVYIEDSIVRHSVVGDNSILSNVDVEGMTIPPNVVLHGLKLKSGKYICRIYGRNDNPKASSNAPFLSGSLSTFLDNAKVSPQEVWGKMTASIWNARIYPECNTMQEAVEAALYIYEMVCGVATEETIKNWEKTTRHSLGSSFNEADVSELLERQQYITNQVKVETFVEALSHGVEMSEAINALNAEHTELIMYLNQIGEIADKSDFPQNMRLYLACAELCKRFDLNSQSYSYAKYEEFAYEVIKEKIADETFKRFQIEFSNLHICKDSVAVELPVRVNFCGSPSDAAPYCLEHGGTMLDGAILLKGKKPVKVTVSRISAKEIRFESIDQRCANTFHNLTEVRDCSNPFDSYALHKAVLVATGIVPFDVESMTMDEFCNQIGGGIEILTDVDVPKGSGLGTSSILAAAAVRAIHELFGIRTTDEIVYAQVFLAEQLMNTGGGWQDQVGGLTGGIKYFTAPPGGYQRITVDVLDISKETMTELNDRFAIIFSGQRRLARNVLREEMNQTIRNSKKALNAIKKIQEYCAIMRYYLLKGDITSFAKYITAQFELVKVLDNGASNICIEYIFDVCEDLIDGKSICGAGGGGFLQVILKKGVSKEELKKRIQENFLDCGVEVWDTQFI